MVFKKILKILFLHFLNFSPPHGARLLQLIDFAMPLSCWVRKGSQDMHSWRESKANEVPFYICWLVRSRYEIECGILVTSIAAAAPRHGKVQERLPSHLNVVLDERNFINRWGERANLTISSATRARNNRTFLFESTTSTCRVVVLTLFLLFAHHQTHTRGMSSSKMLMVQ